MIMVASKLIAIIILFINTAKCDEVKSGGDVHITTIDGVKYDFNGHGEYVFFKANELEIQARTDYVIPGNIQSTMFTAFALYDMKNNEQIEVHLNRNDDVITVYRNGTDICNTSLSGIPLPCERPPKHRCFVLAGNGIVILQHCSIGNYFSKITFASGKFMDISLEPLRHYLTNSSGLAGNASYGFVLRNATMLPNNSAEPDMFAFGESWALQNETESHFNYSISGKSYSFYNGNHTVPIFLETLLGNLTVLFNGWSKDNITFLNKTCRTSWDNRQNDRCLLTIARTGDLALGQQIITQIEEEHTRWLLLHNRRPEFHLPDRISVWYHQAYTLFLKNFTNDENNNSLTFNLTTDIPSQEYNLSADGVFTWRVGPALRSLDTILMFYVFDMFNASASQAVEFNYCGCDKVIQCDYNILSETSTDKVRKASCNCPKYHSGVFCENIIDPCKSMELNCNISCNSSVPQTYASWPCTPCPKGTADHMRGDTQECFDIDECDICYDGDDKCEHVEKCNNTYGSFVCGCRDGYTLNTNTHSCDDINECLNETLCQQNEVCWNVPGTYFCKCAATYQRIGQNNCTKTEVSTFVGSFQFPIITRLTIDQKLNDTINSVENRKKFEKTLTERFNASGQCLEVEVVELSIIKNNVVEIGGGHEQQLFLKVDYVVHWSGNDTTHQIQKALLLSSYMYTTQHFNATLSVDNIQMQSQEIKENKDIDECDISYNGSDKCDQTCHNTDGSFVCGCRDGYTLNANKHSCDVVVQTTINPLVNNKTLMCFACEETFSPAFCERVKSCEDNQFCFVEKISTPEGSIHFKSGCRAQEICEKHHFNTDDGCFECCNGSFCNSRGCGDKGYPARGSRGPVCLECARVNAPKNCDQIKLCFSNQMCFIEEITWGDNSLFHLGCRNVHQCAAEGFVKRSLPTCSTCCDDDFCNVKCRKHDTVIPLIG